MLLVTGTASVSATYHTCESGGVAGAWGGVGMGTFWAGAGPGPIGWLAGDEADLSTAVEAHLM